MILPTESPMLTTADMTPQKLGRVLQERGFVVLERFIGGLQLDAVQAEADWFLNNPRDWFKREVLSHGRMATISPLTIPEAELARLNATSEVFSQPFYQQVCRGYLPHAFVDRLIVHKEQAHNEPVTEWHADQQRKGLHSFKFMLYFNDVTKENGAFSYVPGSHRLTRAVMEAAATVSIPNVEAHNFEEIRGLARSLGLDNCLRDLDLLDEHIRGDYDSDDFYSLEAPRGSLILFDTKGIHRGGVISRGERYLMRLHCFEPMRSWKQSVRRLVGLPRANPRLFW